MAYVRPVEEAVGDDGKGCVRVSTSNQRPQKNDSYLSICTVRLIKSKIDDAAAFENFSGRCSGVQAVSGAVRYQNDIQRFGMLLLQFQKGVQRERSQAPKTGYDVSYVVAEDDGVL